MFSDKIKDDMKYYSKINWGWMGLSHVPIEPEFDRKVRLYLEFCMEKGLPYTVALKQLYRVIDKVTE